MLTQISYYAILGKPLIMYLGLATLASLLFTALIGFLNFRGRTLIPLRWHIRMAAVTVVLALFHGLLGILANL